MLPLPRLALAELFTLPGDALSQALTGLTGLAKADVQRQFMTWASVHVGDLGQIFDEQFAHEPAYQAAQAVMQQLAALVQMAELSEAVWIYTPP